MKIAKGSHRLVFIFDNYVVKCPRFDRLTLSSVFSERRKFLAMIRIGIAENWTEWKTWQRLKSCFLSPVVLSFGIFNIQRRVKGILLAYDEYEEVMKKISEIIGRDSMRINPHFWKDNNFLRSGSSIKVIDYGEVSSNNRLKIETFFLQHRDELVGILCSQ